MCGRFTIKTNASRVAELFHLDEVPALAPRYNIAPTQSVAAIRLANETNRQPKFGMLQWGLIPFWSKDTSIGARMINARAETVTEKPSFRDAFRKRRCLIVADGFYEWKTQGKTKQPYFIHFRDDRPFAFAGLWETWTPKEGEPVESCTIITTTAAPNLAGLHERMPVILNPQDHELWLNGSKGSDLLVPNLADDIVLTRVSTMVNSVKNDSPMCVEAVE